MHTTMESLPQRKDTLIHLAGLRKPDTPVGRLANSVSDMAVHVATRKLRKAGIEVVHRSVDYRPQAPPVSEQRERIKAELLSRMDNGETVTVGGSSAGGNEAHRLASDLGLRSFANQARLQRGTTQHSPTLAEAAKNHPAFIKAVEDFEENVAPRLVEKPDAHITVGAERDSVVPRDLKQTPGVRHTEVKAPQGLFYVLSRIPGLNHGVAIFQGLRHPSVQEFIKK